MRVKVISDPSGMGTPVGSVLVVHDDIGRAMVATERAVEWNEPAQHAGFLPDNQKPTPAVEAVLGENARRQAESDEKEAEKK